MKSFQKTYRNPGDGEPTLPEHDCDIDWWLCICIDDDCGRSKSESVRGLWAGALVLKCSSSLSPMISGDDSRLCSFCRSKKKIKPKFNYFTFDFAIIFNFKREYLLDRLKLVYCHRYPVSVALPWAVPPCAILLSDFGTIPAKKQHKKNETNKKTHRNSGIKYENAITTESGIFQFKLENYTVFGYSLWNETRSEIKPIML